MQRKIENDTIPVHKHRLGHIDPDLEPIYDLTPHQYDNIINALFNLIVDTITRLEKESTQLPSRDLAEQARDIFADYDDDLADILVRYLSTSSQDENASSLSSL